MNISISEFIELSRPLLADGGKVRFLVKGRSMWPLLRSGQDVVVIMSADKLNRGDLVLAEVEPRCFLLHRIVRKDGELLTLSGDGNLKAFEHCLCNDVVGKVVLIVRGTHTIATDGYLYSIYVFICVYLVSPLKRFFVFINVLIN